MVFFNFAVRFESTHEILLLTTLRLHKSSRLCPLSAINQSDLRWWCHFLPRYNCVSIIKISPWLNDRLFLSTDACNTGAGGYFTGLHFHTPFPDAILHRYGHDINILELLAVMVALKLWGALLYGQRITFQCHNINGVLAINSGRSRVPGMQLCLREIWFLTARHDIDIRAKHIPGLENSIADHLSRWHLSPSHQQRFAELTAGFPTTYIFCPTQLFAFEIDL